MNDCNNTSQSCPGQFITPLGGQHLHIHGAVQAPGAYSGPASPCSSESVAQVYLQVAEAFTIPNVGSNGDLKTNLPAPPAPTRLSIPGRGVIEVIAAHGTHVTFKNISIQTGEGFTGHTIAEGAMLQIIDSANSGVVEVEEGADLTEALKGISPGQQFLYHEKDPFGNSVCRFALRISECSKCDVAGTGFLPIPLGTTGPVWASEQTRIAYADQATFDQDVNLDGIQQSGVLDLTSLGIDPAPGSTAHQILIQPENATGTVTINGQLVANLASETSSPVFVTIPIQSSGFFSFEINLTNTGSIEILHIGDVL